MKKSVNLSLAVIAALTMSACGTKSHFAGTANNSEDTAQAIQQNTHTTPVPAPSPDPVEEIIDSLLSSMTTRDKVWQMFMVAPEDIINSSAVTTAGELTQKAIADYPVGGFIYFSRNISSMEQVTRLINGMQSSSSVPLFIAVDEEGGRVARLGNANIGVTKFPAMGVIGKSGDASKAAEVGDTIGTELTEIGFNVDLAPVADVLTVGNNDDIGDRSFGTDPNLVASMVSAEVTAMQQHGLCSTLKHFPSNGSTKTNTHYSAGVCARTLEEMRSVEFIPFKAGIDAGADMVMVGHMAVPDITGDETPSTLSATTIGLLRNELGFSKVVVSDALNMGAITSQYSPSEAAVKAVNAGVDILLMSPDAISAADAITRSVTDGTISEERINESVRRILRLKIERGIIE